MFVGSVGSIASQHCLLMVIYKLGIDFSSYGSWDMHIYIYINKLLDNGTSSYIRGKLFSCINL